MEELRKLEQVQRMLTFTQSHGIITTSSSIHDSNRFLANLVLLLIQPCGDLDIHKKHSLVSEFIPKISVPFLEEASSVWLSQESDTQMENKQRGYVENLSPPNCNEQNCDPLQTVIEELAVVGLDSMQRANSTLEDFCRSYFMFHGMDINKPQLLFKYLPVLSFTESYIYQLDSLNEKTLHIPTSGVTVSERGFDVEANQSWNTKFVDVFKTDPFRPLVGLLECHGLLTERIREEFRCGEEYWALERKLCCALMSKKEISIEDVMRAIQLKSFDYRVLNLLLYQLRGEKPFKLDKLSTNKCQDVGVPKQNRHRANFPQLTTRIKSPYNNSHVNDLHMEFLSISEFLVEVSDDLFDYEDDVLENNFNTLRMFVRIYGPSTAPAMLAKYITEAEEKYNSLLKTLDPQLSLNYQRRCEEATKEGGKISGYPLGTWSIPPVIVDEELYRSNANT